MNGLPGPPRSTALSRHNKTLIKQQSTVTSTSARPRRWRRLWAVIVVAVAFAVFNLGYVRLSRRHFKSHEWQSGWPLVFLCRDVGIDVTSQVPNDWIPHSMLSFHPAAAVVDAVLAIAMMSGVWWYVSGTFLSPRRLQFGLRSMFRCWHGISQRAP